MIYVTECAVKSEQDLQRAQSVICLLLDKVQYFSLVTQSKFQTIITRHISMISLIVFTDKEAESMKSYTYYVTYISHSSPVPVGSQSRDPPKTAGTLCCRRYQVPYYIPYHFTISARAQKQNPTVHYCTTITFFCGWLA